ncbi:hypothetical protein [Luteimonas galliterrae]|uniref:hypothetical protein n=1 Tax=Luteimonas galliterrae TaxID=2940486 RepID=UPI0020199395|nr:hypothetical protein [Luteimonas galliterrae]
MAWALRIHLQGEWITADAGSGEREGNMAGSSDKQKFSLTQVTQWGLQLLLVLAVAAALWR